MLMHGRIVRLRKDDMETTSETILFATIKPISRDNEQLDPVEIVWFKPHYGYRYYSQELGMNFDEAFNKAKIGSKVLFINNFPGIIVED